MKHYENLNNHPVLQEILDEYSLSLEHQLASGVTGNCRLASEYLTKQLIYRAQLDTRHFYTINREQFKKNSPADCFVMAEALLAHNIIDIRAYTLLYDMRHLGNKGVHIDYDYQFDPMSKEEKLRRGQDLFSRLGEYLPRFLSLVPTPMEPARWELEQLQGRYQTIPGYVFPVLADKVKEKKAAVQVAAEPAVSLKKKEKKTRAKKKKNQEEVVQAEAEEKQPEAAAKNKKNASRRARQRRKAVVQLQA